MHPRPDSFDTLRALPTAGKGPSTPLVPAVSRALALLERLAGAREPMTPGAAGRRPGAAEEQRPRPVQHPGVVRLPAPPARRLLPDRPARHGPGRGVRLRHRRRPGVQRPLGRRRQRARGNGRPLGPVRHRCALRRREEERPAARPGVQRRHAPAGLSLRQRQGDARLAAGRRGAPPLRRPAWARASPTRARATSRRCSRSWRWRGGAATASTTKACAKASIRSARRCSAPPARPSPRSRSASTRRSSAAIAAAAIATRPSPSPPTCRAGSAATPGRRAARGGAA